MPFKVLIVDDEPLAAQALARMCKLLGHDVFVAQESGPAVRFLHQRRPDIVFTDLDMPGISGLDLCDYIKHDPHLKHIPVVFVSANDQDEAMWAGMQAGAADYLVKPVDFDALEGTLSRLL
ncbi:MAG: response regulator [Anaerolineae bacterium]|nr:response regulator [Anaerolineae bacterium]